MQRKVLYAILTLRRPSIPSPVEFITVTRNKILGCNVLDRKLLTQCPRESAKLQQGYQRLKLLYLLMSRKKIPQMETFIIILQTSSSVHLTCTLLRYGKVVWKQYVYKIQVFQSKVLGIKANAPCGLRYPVQVSLSLLWLNIEKRKRKKFLGQSSRSSGVQYCCWSDRPKVRRLKRKRFRAEQVRAVQTIARTRKSGRNFEGPGSVRSTGCSKAFRFYEKP